MTSAHYFKDDGLYYVFNEERIYSKCKLIQQARKSKSQNPYSTVNLNGIDSVHSNNTMIHNKSNSLKRGSNKRKSKKKLRKQKSNQSKSRSKDKDKVGASTPKKDQNPKLMYGLRSNTFDHTQEKSVKDLKLNEWSDSDQEYGDVFSSSDIMNSPSNNNYNQPRSPRSQRGKHSKKRSISLPWFGGN